MCLLPILLPGAYLNSCLPRRSLAQAVWVTCICLGSVPPYIFTTMGWEWNAEDPQELHGWVWVEGQWPWGATHPWHVVDVTWPHHRQWPTPKYVWICNHWRWLPSDGTLSGGYWLGEELHTYEELDETNTEDWMVHPLEPHGIAHEICNVKNIT